MRAYERSFFVQEDVRGTDLLIVLLEKYVIITCIRTLREK